MPRSSLVDGVAGVEVQTEKVWAFAERVQTAARHRDQQAGSRTRRLSSAPWPASRRIFGRTAVPIHLPIGAERDFKGIVDLIRMKAFTYTPDGDGKGKEGDIPAEYAEEAQTAHEALVEMVAEGNDAYMEEFFEKGTLPVEHILDGMRTGIREMRIFPVHVRRRQPQHRQRFDPRPDRRRYAESHRARRDHGVRQRHRGAPPDRRKRPGLGISSSRPPPIPFAGRINLLPRGSPASSRTMPTCRT